MPEHSVPSDEELISRFRAGDRSAFTRLEERWKQWLSGVMARRHVLGAARSDSVELTWLLVAAKIEGGHFPVPGGCLAHWVISIVYTDEELVDHFLLGHEFAFELLQKRFTRRLYGVMKKSGMAEADWDDSVQETWLRAYLKIRLFDPARGCFATWLTRIALHETVDHWRRTHPERQVPPKQTKDGADDWEAYAASQSGVDEELMMCRRLDALDECIARLAEPARAVVRLRREGLLYREIAVELGIGVSTVKETENRARLLLTACLEKRGWGVSNAYGRTPANINSAQVK